MHITFFCLGKFLKWLADDQFSSMTKGSICYIKHMYIQPVSMGVDWEEIWYQMDVSTMFYFFRYCLFFFVGQLWGHVQNIPWLVILIALFHLKYHTLCLINQNQNQNWFINSIQFNVICSNLETLPILFTHVMWCFRLIVAANEVYVSLLSLHKKEVLLKGTKYYKKSNLDWPLWRSYGVHGLQPTLFDTTGVYQHSTAKRLRKLLGDWITQIW